MWELEFIDMNGSKGALKGMGVRQQGTWAKQVHWPARVFDPPSSRVT
jgi:hypothetical protein